MNNTEVAIKFQQERALKYGNSRLHGRDRDDPLSYTPVGSITTHQIHAGYLMGLDWDDDHRVTAMAGLRVQYRELPHDIFQPYRFPDVSGPVNRKVLLRTALTPSRYFYFYTPEFGRFGSLSNLCN
jgi:hypothetical protein